MAELKLKIEEMSRTGNYTKTTQILNTGKDRRSTSELNFSDISGYSADKRHNLELQKNLRKFVLAYIKEQPNDIIDYAVIHFTEIQQQRNRRAASLAEKVSIDDNKSSLSADTDEKKNPSQDDASHRTSVFSETFDSRASILTLLRNIRPKTDAQRKRLLVSIQNCVIFKKLELEKMNQIMDAMYEMIVEPDEVIIEEGTEGDNFYVIEQGTYDILKEGKQINTLNEGGFGEMALLYSAPRHATVKAHTDGKLWVLDRETFRNILQKHALREMAKYQDLVNCTPLFKDLTRYELMRVLEHLVVEEVKKGTEITLYGEKGEGMYFVEEGQVSVFAYTDEGDTFFVHYLTKGDYFGEIELILKTNTIAFVRAETDVKLQFLSAENFKFYMGNTMETLISRIQEYMLRDDYISDKLRSLLETREEEKKLEDVYQN